MKTFGHLNPDIFIATYNRRYNYHPHIQGKFNIADDEEMTPQRISELFSDLKVCGLLIDSNSSNYEVPAEVAAVHRDHQSTYYQYLKFKQAVDLMEGYELANNFKYDLVIRARTDLMYADKFTIAIGEKDVIVDSSNTFPNDWIFFTARDNMVNISKNIQEEFVNPKHADGHLTPPHNLLRNAMYDSGLTILTDRIVEYVLRKNDIRDYYR